MGREVGAREGLGRGCKLFVNISPQLTELVDIQQTYSCLDQ